MCIRDSTSKGMNIANLLPISQDERVTSMIRVPEFDEDRYLVMVTRNGVIKRTPLSAFQTTRKGGVIAIDLDEGDELSWVRLTDGSEMCIRDSNSTAEVAMQYNDSYNELILSFANNIHTTDGGTHEDGFKPVSYTHLKQNKQAFHFKTPASFNCRINTR